MITRSIIKAKDFDVKIKNNRDEAFIPLNEHPDYIKFINEIDKLRRENSVMSEYIEKELNSVKNEISAIKGQITNVKLEFDVLTRTVNYIERGLKRR